MANFHSVIAVLLGILGLLLADPLPHGGHHEQEYGQPEVRFYHYQNGSATDYRLSFSQHIGAGWTSIGIGSKMENALMFVLYPSGQPGEATVTVRTAEGHQPPQIYPKADLRVLRAYTKDELMFAELICYACTTWPGGSLSISDAAHPFIWANGPSFGPSVREGDDQLNKHLEYGHFTIDMVAAATTIEEASESAADEGQSPSTPSGTEGEEAERRGKVHFLVYLHAWLLGPMFVFLTPTAILLLRWPRTKSVGWHQVIQAVSAGIAVAGFLIAMNMSRNEKEWSDFNNPHQIIGIVTLLSMAGQATLGWLNHQRFVASKGQVNAAHQRRSLLHVWLGRAIWPLGMLNAVFGLNWAGKSGLAGLTAVVAIAVFGATMWLVWRWDVVRLSKRGAGELGAYEMVDGGVRSGGKTDDEEPFALHDADDEEEMTDEEGEADRMTKAAATPH